MKKWNMYMEDIPLLRENNITEFYNVITENHNAKVNSQGNCRPHKNSLSFFSISCFFSMTIRT